MTIDLNASNIRWHLLSPQEQPIYFNEELINYVIKTAKILGYEDWKSIAKAFPYKNTEKVLTALNGFYRTSRLITPYLLKLIEILGLDLQHIKALEAKHKDALLKDLTCLRDNHQLFIDDIDTIISTKAYYNVSFYGLLLSSAYVGRRYPIVLGELLLHWSRGKFIVKDRCCGDVFIYGAGGSPLSGNNYFSGFCSTCKKAISGSLDSFNTVFSPFMNHKPHFPYEASNEKVVSIYDSLKHGGSLCSAKI